MPLCDSNRIFFYILQKYNILGIVVPVIMKQIITDYLFLSSCYNI